MSTDQKQEGDEAAQKQSRKLPRLPRKWKLTIILVLILALGTLSWSIGRTLAAPGTDTVAARLAEWGRDHGLGSAVTADPRPWSRPHSAKRAATVSVPGAASVRPIDQERVPKARIKTRIMVSFHLRGSRGNFRDCFCAASSPSCFWSVLIVLSCLT